MIVLFLYLVVQHLSSSSHFTLLPFFLLSFIFSFLIFPPMCIPPSVLFFSVHPIFPGCCCFRHPSGLAPTCTHKHTNQIKWVFWKPVKEKCMHHTYQNRLRGGERWCASFYLNKIVLCHILYTSVPHHTTSVKGLLAAGTHAHSARFMGLSG